VTEVSHRFTNEMLIDIRSLGINTHSFARTSDYIELARELVRGLGNCQLECMPRYNFAFFIQKAFTNVLTRSDNSRVDIAPGKKIL
jgi:hypothetical protein